ncbi:MAG: hypothetical protein Q8M57_10455 [Nitrosomonas sp.]|uniref:hypothetical protein n=1 Tax=Nitrosomonas sp. TaxID=42353 RepID=UPI00273721B1|nr:hypothetical protein [Nitrosomonas sp.]MDP3281448.1 hypothetical protein [Nitrosomonas sp.]
MAKKNLSNEENIPDIKDALIKKVEATRSRWRKIVISKKLDRYTTQGESERSPKKILYFVKPGSWWKNMQGEINELEIEIKEAGFAGRKKPRSIWLPTMLENAVEITIKAYQAKAVRSVSIDTAHNFKSDARSGHNVRLRGTKDNPRNYGIDSLTGRNYKLRVITTLSSDILYENFTNWTVCLCSDGTLPDIYEESPEYTAKSDSKMHLCSSKDRKRFLFEVKD